MSACWKHSLSLECFRSFITAEGKGKCEPYIWTQDKEDALRSGSIEERQVPLVLRIMFLQDQIFDIHTTKSVIHVKVCYDLSASKTQEGYLVFIRTLNKKSGVY